MDVASLEFKHIRTDDDGNYVATIKSSLNDLFSLEANIDQTGTQFVQDIIHSMCDEGVVALVPIQTDKSPNVYGGWNIDSIRVGQIVEWYPKDIRVNLYNVETGMHEEVVVPKKSCAIIENPMSAVMNEPSSTLRRLTDKLNQLDIVDEQSSSGKLDIIIQLPYTIKTATKQKQADERKKQIEEQMKGSKYGIAYIDAAEKITQLNRPAENQLLAQVEYLTSMLYNQLGLTKGIFDGSASEEEILNYFNRTIEPFAGALTDEVRRKFLTKTARSQNQDFDFFRDLFKLVPISQLAELADKLTRNEVVSSNEFRGFIGMKPHKDPKANELRNKNLNVKEDPNATTNATTNEKVKIEDVSKKGEVE